MIAWLRRLLDPPPRRAARGHEPTLHAARNARAAVVLNADLVARRARRETDRSRAVVAAIDSPTREEALSSLWGEPWWRGDDGRA